jgi:DNA modification methylase
MRNKTDLLNSVSRPNFDGIRLFIEYVSPAAISVPRRELRKHSKSDIKRLAAGMDGFGNNVPSLVDENLGLVSGYARLAAAKLLGLDTVPVIRIGHLTDEQLELFRIFDNKIAEAGEWDLEALHLTFEELKLADPDLDPTGSGFAVAELDMIDGATLTAELNDLDDTREPAADHVLVTRLGDVWECGPHRILCGNSLDPAAIELLVGDAAIRQHLSDPPYNLPTRTFSSTDRHGDFTMAAGEMSSSEFARFLRRYLTAAQPHLIDGSLVYAFMDHRHIVELIVAAEAAGLTYENLLVWVKGRAGQGSFYRSGHELVGVFRHGSGKALNNIQLGAHGRNRSNVLSYPGVMGSGGRKKALAMHPSVKNVAMLADLLLDASAPGEGVLDSFGGSGSTLIAAEKTGRVAYLCELAPGYVDIAVERFNALGAEPARLAETGQTFAEVAAERLSGGVGAEGR